MIDEQIENWIRKMQTACNRSALDSDINIIKLIQHIKDLYEQGRADERQACIDIIETYQIPVGNSPQGELAADWTYAALHQIRDEIKQRGEK